MKRKYRDVQEILDDMLLQAIIEGETRNSALKSKVRETLVEHLTATDKIPLAYLLDVLCSAELIAAKQRLRDAGHVEITKGNQVCRADAITSDDAEFIDQRRASHIVGELKTRVAFNRRYGRHEAAAEAVRQLTMIAPAAEIAVENYQETSTP